MSKFICLFLPILLLCSLLASPLNAAPAENIRQLQQTAETGDANAKTKLGMKYLTGERIKQDYQKASEWYTKSAEQGYANAQFRLGYMHALGEGVQQDYQITRA